MGGVKLYDMSMREISLRGVKWLEFTPDPPTAEEATEKVYNGDIPMGKTRNSRLIQAKLWYKAYDVLDYKLLRDELFSFLSPFQEFYVVDEDDRSVIVLRVLQESMNWQLILKQWLKKNN